jgi:hypothetical protein
VKKSSRISLAVLTAALVFVAVLVVREGLSGVTFRAGDYDSIQECLANIPREWLPGSMEHTRSEQACHYEARRRAEERGR